MNDDAALREAAARLLARREHSRRELETKLVRKGWDAGQVAEIVARFAETGLQSDTRFAESYARNRAERGYGPLRIRAELNERGIDKADARAALEDLDADWTENARAWYRRKYGDSPPEDQREKARRLQALGRRGFAHEHLRGLFDEHD